MTEIPKLKLNTKTAISDQIYSFLRSLIISTKITPGSSFSENALSAHFSVSRQPVRVALNNLEHDGLISVYPQKGTVVKKISIKNLRQVVFVRSSLECASIDNIKNLSVDKFASVIKKLKNNIRDQEKKIDKDNLAQTFLPLDDKFHEIICSFSDCEMTWPLIQSVKGHLDRIRYLSLGNESPVESLIEHHKTIFQAIEDYDYERVKELLREHHNEVLQTHISIKRKYEQWFEE